MMFLRWLFIVSRTLGFEKPEHTMTGLKSIAIGEATLCGFSPFDPCVGSLLPRFPSEKSAMSLALKIILTPTLIGLASLAGRRWGPAVSGWLVGLPFTSGPVAFFLALDHGTTFAAAAATGTLTGTFSEVFFCLAYGWCALLFPWPVAALSGGAAFLLETFALRYLTLPLVPTFLFAVVALTIGLRLMRPIIDRAKRATPAKTPHSSEPSSINKPPSWDLPARMVISTVFVVLLTAVASALGPHLAGLLATFPLYATILAAFAHQQQGSLAAAGVLRGLLFGLFAFASFFLALAALLPRVGIAPSFMAATALCLVVQFGALWVLRRMMRAERAGGLAGV